MTRTRPSLLIVLAAIVASAAPAPAAPAAAAAAPAAADTRDYVVQPGDTCVGIAARELGDRNAYVVIHRLNPWLGPMPHTLVAGTVLRLPRKGGVDAPDARITAERGEVRVKKPAATDWFEAARGMDLFRAWRVGADEASSAELTFQDDSRLRMRERTIVIVYGPEASRAKTITASAELEQGTLETRLGELGGRKVAVRTPTADAELTGGRAIVALGGDGASIVANHAGKPVTVRGKGARAGKPVAVAAGMGSKVRPGKAPDAPRPLPPAPAWTSSPTTFAAVGDRAALTGAWAAVAAAARYRVAITDDRDEPIAALEVAAPATSFTAPGLPPGDYVVTVAAIDADGFESAPSEPLALGLVAVGVEPPEVGGPAPEPAAAAAPDQPVPVALGTTIVAPAGGRCGAGADAGPRTTLVAPGPATIACTTRDGTPVAAIAVVVLAAADVRAPAIARGTLVEVEVPLAPGRPVDHLDVTASRGLRVVGSRVDGDHLVVALDVAPDAPADGTVLAAAAGNLIAAQPVAIVDAAHGARAAAPASTGPAAPTPAGPAGPARLELGGFLGEHVFPTGDLALDLGRPTSDAYAVVSGPAFGARIGLYPRPRWGGEVEGAIVQTTYADAPGRATILSGRAHAAWIALDHVVAVRLLAGVGVHALLDNTGGSTADALPFLDVGAALTVPIGGRASLRLDARDELGEARSGWSQGLDLSLGFALALDR